MTTYQTLGLVPSDDWDQLAQIIGEDDQPVDLTGYTVIVAVIAWDDNSQQVAVTFPDPENGMLRMHVTETDTVAIPLGRLSQLTVQLQSPSGDDQTPIHAHIEGRRTMSVCKTAIFKTPGTQGPPGIGDKYTEKLFVQGRPASAELLLQSLFEQTVQFPEHMAGSLAHAETAAVGTAVFGLRKNNIAFGTLTFDASATGTFQVTGITEFNANDKLSIWAPAVQDSALADISITLAGDRITQPS